MRFQIDAQYRGAVKKNFNSIGQTGIRIVPGTDGAFKMVGGGKVTHPKERAQVYEFALDMEFKLAGDRIEYRANNNTCNELAKGLKGRIEKLLPFVYVVGTLPSQGGMRS